MNVTVRFADGGMPQTIEAITAPEALRQVGRADAYVAIPCAGGYELLNYDPANDRFRNAVGRSISQAFETLFDGEVAP